MSLLPRVLIIADPEIEKSGYANLAQALQIAGFDPEITEDAVLEGSAAWIGHEKGAEQLSAAPEDVATLAVRGPISKASCSRLVDAISALTKTARRRGYTKSGISYESGNYARTGGIDGANSNPAGIVPSRYQEPQPEAITAADEAPEAIRGVGSEDTDIDGFLREIEQSISAKPWSKAVPSKGEPFRLENGGMHYGVSRQFGPHFGVGPHHFYKNRIHTGGRRGKGRPLTPEQQQVVAKLLAAIRA
jgi:hypothetical protein